MVSMDVVHDRQFGAALFFFLHNRKPRKSSFFREIGATVYRGGRAPPDPPLQQRPAAAEARAKFNSTSKITDF